MSNSIAKYFQNVGAKRLSAVEVERKTSNQHEFNGSSVFKRFLGTETLKFQGRFIYLNDDEDGILENHGALTWYDTRKKQTHRSAEFRLYYTDNDVILSASNGDLLIIGLTTTDQLLLIIAQKGSTAEKQLLWLFELQEVENKFVLKDFSTEKAELGFAAKYILTTLGIEIEESAPDYLEEILKRFKGKLPPTKEFSAYARSTIKDVSPIEAPDETLVKWMEREMMLFKTIEAKEIKEKLSEGFGKDGLDVDDFIKFSLSMQNRRKARAGAAFENHLSTIFDFNNVMFSNGAVTERNNKPDFIFPSIKHYHDENFNVDLLTMLGLKTTAKDRWRQVLPEADRLPNKHLITLEPAISKKQTEEMKIRNVQLIIPKPIIPTYNLDQQTSIIDLFDFIKYVSGKQVKT